MFPLVNNAAPTGIIYRNETNAKAKFVERIINEENTRTCRGCWESRHVSLRKIRLRPRYPNHVWSIDFVHDRLSNGRCYKMLTVLDEYTCEALSVKVATKMGSAEVLEALYPLLLRHGKPRGLENVAEIRQRPRSPPLGDLTKGSSVISPLVL